MKHLYLMLFVAFVFFPHKSEALIPPSENSYYESPTVDADLQALDLDTAMQISATKRNQNVATEVLSYIILICFALLVYVLYRNKKLTDTFRKLRGDFKEKEN